MAVTLSRNYLHFMGPEGMLLCSEQLATGLCSKPSESALSCFFKSVFILASHLAHVLKEIASFLQDL
jgi:hypothetical protein